MAGKYTWKLLLIGAVLLFAVSNLIPLRNTEFKTYFTEHATPGPELTALVSQAEERQAASDGAKSFYVALREVAEEEQIDISRFFPEVRLEQSLVNLTKRNTILLDHLLQESRGRIKLGLDLRGGVSVILEVDEAAAAAATAGQTEEAAAVEREEELEKAIQIIRARIDAFGVAEPIIRPVGDNRIEVQLAGVSTKENPDIFDLIQKPARLEFSLVYMDGTPETVPQDQVPPIYRPMTLEQEHQGEVRTEQLYIKMVPEMTGEGIDYARAQYNEYGSPEIALKFTDEGAERFAEITRTIEEENVRNRRGEGSYGRLAIILDGKLYSAPSVREEIRGGNAVIYGSFTAREALELADVLKNPLDLPLRIAEMSEVGPSLARDSIESGRRAFIWAVAIIALFMAIYYTMAGVLALVSMAFNVVVIVGVMASFGATMSMPGIAGLVLTLGMAVDSNILIFERMREEVGSGKNLRASLEAGFEKAFSAILDANVTTLITASIMMSLGTGPVKGFGVVLTIGIFSTMFAALLVSRVLLELIVHTNIVKRLKFLSFVPSTAIDFMRFFRPAFITSWTIVLIGVIMVVVKGNDIYGVDFTGGDELTLDFEQRVEVADIRAAAQLAGVQDVLPVYTAPIGGGTEQLKLQTPFEQSDVVLAKLNELHPEAGFEFAGESRIGASVSSQIKWNAGIAIALSLVGILLYVAFRFEMGYGVGAVIATVHDLFMTIGIFVMCGRQFNAAMVGAVLLVVGYSINDTIVVFDRIREELALNPNMRLRDVINHSLNRTLNRTLITSSTTLFTALMLFFIAGGAVNDLALTLIIGILTGTFSSIFIASPVFYWWHKGDRKHVEASHDITPKYEWSASSRAAQ